MDDIDDNDPYDKNKVRGMGMNLVNWELEYLLMKLTTWMIKIHMGEIQWDGWNWPNHENFMWLRLIIIC